MKLKLLGFLLIAVFFEFFFTRTVFADTFTLSGSVKDSSGNAIAGTIIKVNDVNSDSTATDSSGNYSLSVLGGTYDVQVTPPSGSNYSSVIALSQNILSNKILNFILVPAGTITLSGHVYDSLGNPLSSQTVELSGGFNPSATTDSSGSYSLTASPTTYNYLVITGTNNNSSLNIPQNYRIAVNNYPLTQSAILDITIPAKKVNIHVQDAAGNPISNVAIKTGGGLVNYYQLSIGGNITNAVVNDSSYGQYGPAPVTDALGNTVLWLLPNSSGYFYTFTATPPAGSNFLAATLFNITITSDSSKTITLQQPVILSGHVYDSLGNPVANQQMRLYAGNINQITSTDESGSYSLQVSPGTYGLNVSANNNSLSWNVPQSYLIGVDNITLSQNTTLDIAIPAKKITLHLQDAAGNPISNVSITIPGGGLVNYHNLSIGGGISNATANSSNYGQTGPAPVTNASGNVILWLLPNSSGYSYAFTATPPSGSNFLATTLSSISVNSDATETIILQQPVTLSGHIYDSLGNPLPNQTVQLLGGSNPTTTTDDTGNYSLLASTGIYGNLIITSANNSSSLNIPQSFRIGVPEYTLTQDTVLEITIPAKKVSFHVQDALGNPVSNIGIKTGGGLVNYYNLPIGGNIINAVVTASDYGQNGSAPITDQSGNVILWLLPNSSGYSYTFTATPPSGSIYNTFTLNNISIMSDQTELISLQYSHNPPVTTVTLATQKTDGTYSNPTTASFFATTVAGYAVANTYYIIDSGSQQVYSTPFTITGNGSHTITYWSVDDSGVIESPKTKTFTIYQNQTPYVNSFLDTTINEGKTYTKEVSFADIDSTSWTGSVNYGDGTAQLLELNPDQTFSLNHPYKDNGVYAVTVKVTDDQGATGVKTAIVTVNNLPPSTGTITIPTDPITINTSITATASFTDQGVLDSHTATWNWGDGTTTNETVTEENGGGTVSDNHTYINPGIYTITLTITDNDGGKDTRSTTSYIVIYDPSGGFITGSGHFNSPIGAYPSKPQTGGEVKFGIHAKYKDNAPEGKTKLNFKETNLNFESTSYDWYVITGNKAQLKGTGTINGKGTYTFLATIIDTGEPEGERKDTIRIKITDTNGALIYDTQPGNTDTADPIIPVENGSIKIHK